MTDSGGPPSRTLCFLSTLLSQKVPEKSAAVLRCIISGQPKPEVTWYKNGHVIDEWGIVSSYEFFENQSIHVLHLSCCTQDDAAVYQVSARNRFGMICCSASVEVECSSENTHLSPNLENDKDTGWKHEPGTHEGKGTNPTDEKGHPHKEEESVSPGTPSSADSSPSKSSRSPSLQLLTSNDTSASSSEKPLDIKGERQTGGTYDQSHTEEIAEGWLSLHSSHTPEKQGVCCPQAMPSNTPRLVDGGQNHDGPKDGVLPSSQQNSKLQKYVSFSLPLSGPTAHIYPGDSTTVNKQGGPQVSSEDSNSDYELCPEITLTCTEEFSDDDLEYLECSDVMTDYSNAAWQRNLQGTERVFLLESDDEEMEFSECCLGGCEHFLSEMGCGPRVSGDTGPMDAPAGFCGYHSQPQDVGVRSGRVFPRCPLSPHTGMTLTLGPHQDGTSLVTEQGGYPLPNAPEAAENDYPGIQGETRDSHPAREEFESDNLLNMEKAVTGKEMQPLPGEAKKSGMHRCWETAAEKREGEKDLGNKRGPQKPTRAGRPGLKGKPKKLNASPKASTAEGTVDLLCPKEPAKPPLSQSDTREASRTPAGTTDWNSHLHAGECAVAPQAEQEAKALQTPADSLPTEGSTHFQGKGMRVDNLFETSQVPGQSDQPQVQIQEALGERISVGQITAFSEPTKEEYLFTGTTINYFPNSGGAHKRNASLTPCLAVESCARDPQHKEKQDREGNTPGDFREELTHEPSIPGAKAETMSLGAFSGHLPQDAHVDYREPGALSVASPDPTDTAFTLANVGDGARDGEAAWMTECFEAGDQETCDTADSPVRAPVDIYVPQDVCSVDSEMAEGQSKISDLCAPDGKTLQVFFQTRGSETPLTTCESSKEYDRTSAPLFISTFTWSISPKANEGATGGCLAKVENPSCPLASTAQAGQGGLSPRNLGGLEKTHLLSSENTSFVQMTEGDKSPKTSAPDTTDTPARLSSTGTFLREKSTTLIANNECLLVTRETEGMSVVSVATKVCPTQYLAVSVAENKPAEGTEESLPQTPEEDISQFPSSVQLCHILNDSTTESPKELLCTAPSVLGVHGHVPQLPEGEGLCSNSSLQIDNQSGDKSQAVDRTDTKSPEDNFQEKRSATKHWIQQQCVSVQGFLSAGNSPESLPMISAAQEERHLVPQGHSPASSRVEGGKDSGQGTSVLVVTEATVEDDSQALSNVPSLSSVFLERSKECGPGNWEAGNKLVRTVEASVSEVRSPRQPTSSQCKDAEAGSIIPGRVWAVSDILETEVTMPEMVPSETAELTHSPLGVDSALDAKRETCKGEGPTISAHCRALSPQDLSQPRVLESSVDPVDEQELCAADSPTGASAARGTGDVNNVTQSQEGSQRAADHTPFFRRFLSCPQILESSVDPADETGVMEFTLAVKLEPSESTLGGIGEGSKLCDGDLGLRTEVQPAILQVLCPRESAGTLPGGKRNDRSREGGERGEAKQSLRDETTVEVQSAIWQAPHPDKGGERIPGGGSTGQTQEGSDGSLEEAGKSKKDKAEVISPTSPLSSCLARMTHASLGVHTHSSPGQIHDVPGNDLAEPRNQHVFPHLKERGTLENECGKHTPPSHGLTRQPCPLILDGNLLNFSISHKIEEPRKGELQTGQTKPPSSTGTPAKPLAFISGEGESEKAPELLRGPCPKGTLSCVRESRAMGKPRHKVAPTGQVPRAPPAGTGSEEVKKKQEDSGSGHLAEGVKKKILSRVAALRLKLEEKENVRKNSSFLKKVPKLETSLSRTDEKKDPQKPPCRREGKAPVLLKKIQAEMFPDHSGNVKLSCQFAEIHEDSTIWWTKDSKSIAQVRRSAGDNSTVSFAIVQASQKDQGLYFCCIKNSYGKVSAEFNLTAEVLKQLSSHQEAKGCEEIEFSQLIFREDFLHDSYFGDHLRGQIATEELHFGEGVHRKAFRSKVMQGLTPVFKPGHACVLKVHNAVAYGTRNNDELVQRNYKLATQECYVQNTARYYAKIYAAEAQPLEGFGEVPEIIPIFLIHRPENNIPYATVEEELIGEFVKYSIRDGKEINFLRRDSEAGQKCCTFQHWVYQKTSGCLLVTDMQGVGMKLTDVGIATLAKGYKGFQGNCSMTFIDQFKALHQCNKYCKMLGLKSLQNNNQKQKKPSPGKSKIQTNSTARRKTEAGTPTEKKT
ncbi:alpha-protein kinase 2 [Carlito syrichta]|uniref:Alpha-protein kinase 2 n=1 Tax=Carlito syrichta TaxID=1868482 RepID=A0A1U7UDQ1_CARSF|nr:alpha-protein kinase 2 [Carlito syrichta]